MKKVAEASRTHEYPIYSETFTSNIYLTLGLRHPTFITTLLGHYKNSKGIKFDELIKEKYGKYQRDLVFDAILKKNVYYYHTGIFYI